MNRAGARVLVLLVALGMGWYAWRHPGEPSLVTPPGPHPAAAQPAGNPTLDQTASGRMLRISGQVQRILADDRDGSRHQRFILATEVGTTLLIAHNIDLAPRLEGLAAGDKVEVYGEYEWNEKGGLLHWTHRDPDGSHRAGYIEWRGRRYQ